MRLGNASLARLRDRVLPPRGAERSLKIVERSCRALLNEPGEPASLATATAIVEWIRSADEAATAAFLELLATAFDPDPDDVARAVRAWTDSPGEPDAGARLRLAVEAPRLDLFRRLNMAPGGTHTLVVLRGRLLRTLRSQPELRRVDADLQHLFEAWFNPGFLVLERIDWETPADILERLIRYEAVHEIRGWDDLRARLARDRRCFAFFHPVMPREPLVFVEVALTNGMSDSIRPLIDPGRPIDDPAEADAAIFYAISNCHAGLRGVSLGSFLIKRVVAELAQEFAGIKTFATLSPIPGLAGWVERNGEGIRNLAGMGRLIAAAAEDPTAGPAPTGEVAPWLGNLLADRDARETEPVAAALVLAYFLSGPVGGRAGDPVAHFHLTNGASVDRVNVGANPSPAGALSLGLMVNYRYDRDSLEANHEAYVRTGTIAMSGSLRRIAKPLLGARSPTTS